MLESRTPGAVTLAFSRRVRPGADAAFEAWLREIAAVSARQPGHLGATVIRPGTAAPGGARIFTVVFRFATEEAWRQWANAPERLALIERAEASSEIAQDLQQAEGLDYWFTLPGAPPEPVPEKWKLALVLTLCVYGLLQVVMLAFGPLVPTLPWRLVQFFEVGTVASLMTWFVMPAVTRQLRGWLFAPGREG